MRGLLILAALMLAGCALRQARVDYEDSAERYKACLAAKGPSACEAERLIMETDERKFGNFTSAVSGNSESSNVTVMRR
jgi:hypothetical protein